MKQHSFGFSRFAALAAGVVVCAMLPLVSCGSPCDLPNASWAASAACQPRGCVEGSGTVLSATLVCSVWGFEATQYRYQALLRLPGSSSSLTVDTVTLQSISPGNVLDVMAVASNPREGLFTSVGWATASSPGGTQGQQIVYHDGRATAPLHCLAGASGCSGQTLTFTLGGLSFRVALSAETTMLGFGTPVSITPGQAVDVTGEQTGGHLNATVQVANAALFTDFPLPTKGSNPSGITSGPDGNLWFTEQQANRIGRMTPAGAITEFLLPRSNNQPGGITVGPDGNLWFTEDQGNRIGRITPTGAITEFLLPRSDNYPAGITTGPDGNLWFTESGWNRIGRMTPAGTLTEFFIPTWSSNPGEITNGPDGNLWFTELGGDKIGRITPEGIITEFPLSSGSGAIATGPDGNLWFTEGNEIGRMTPAGVLSEFPLPVHDSDPIGITAGSDGSLWFTEYRRNVLGRITPEGAITEVPLPTLQGYAEAITTGPDGSLWFTEQYGNQIGHRASEKEAASA